MTTLPLLTLLAVPLAGAPISLVHDTPPTAPMGKPLAITVGVEGSLEESAVLRIHYRPMGAGLYQTAILRPDAQGKLQAMIPASATAAPQVRYYIEAIDGSSGLNLRLGSPEHPMSVPLTKPDARRGSGLLARAGVTAVPLLLAGGFVFFRDHRRRTAAGEQAFWNRVLGPIAGASPDTVDARIATLAATALDHPVHGPRMFSKRDLLEQLDRIRRQDPRKADATRASAGTTAAATAAPAASPAEDVRGALGNLASRIGQLAAMAWFQSSSAREGHAGNAMVQSLAETKEAVQQAQARYKEGKVDEARALLDTLEKQLANVATAVARADAQRPVEEIAYRLASASTMPADVLGRLVDYYVFTAPREPGNREKLIAVTQLLVERDAVDAGDPRGVRKSLGRRGLLRGTEQAAPGQEILSRAEELRTELDAKITGMAVLEGLRARLDALRAELGAQLFSLDGLSAVVALEVTLKRRCTEVERATLGALDDMVNDLEGVAESETRPAPEALEEDERAALALLESTEEELFAAIGANACEERGFYLEGPELLTLTTPGADEAWAALAACSTVCRTAIDRLAKSHARARQPEGQEPEPLPRALAVGLVRRAAMIETDLQEQVELALRRGDLAAAREVTRHIHRLSRARIGLAVLGGLPPSGWAREEVVHA